MSTKEELEQELKELREAFDPYYQYIDNFTLWSKQSQINNRIQQVKQQLREHNGQNDNNSTGEKDTPDSER